MIITELDRLLKRTLIDRPAVTRPDERIPEEIALQFRVADLTLHWTGTDDTTPPGHIIAAGHDPFGDLRVFLWVGNTPADDAYRGSLLIKHHQAVAAYGPSGSYVTGLGDQTALLARLADNGLRRTND
ncbi:hypothetical protein [Kitasatospora atroaurantiaca]|uniref:hypothetical protein n=1 Tax=Kitasatospora atroaurantiaca TaxID=285545 RepID=UPI0011A19C20|nr:hypothetical protein [Kitasatospora atroaurantiaca]